MLVSSEGDLVPKPQQRKQKGMLHEIRAKTSLDPTKHTVVRIESSTSVGPNNTSMQTQTACNVGSRMQANETLHLSACPSDNNTGT